MADAPAITPLNPTVVRWLVCLGAGLTTFVASVMAEEQNQRLKNSSFGTAAGAFAGALIALINKDQDLVAIGFFGSAIGALGGWFASLLLSFSAARSAIGRTLIEYQIGGWPAVRDRLSLEEREPLLNALVRWGRNFARFIQTQKTELVEMGGGAERDYAAGIVIRGWLLSVVEIVDLLFGLGKRPNYRSRVTIIVFGKDTSGKIVGKHWISDSGRLPSHKKGMDFDANSIGYQVLSGKLPSPYFTTGDEAKQKGQDRGEQKYRPFLTYRLNGSAIAAVDWPGDIKEDDPFLVATRELFQLDIVPATSEVLELWSTDVASVVNLTKL